LTNNNHPEKKHFSGKRVLGVLERKDNNEEKRKGSGVFLSALKNFGIIFISCLLIFGLIASFAVSLITATMDDILSTEKDALDEILKGQDDKKKEESVDYEIPDGNSFTSLFIVTDYDPDFYTYYPEGEALAQLNSERYNNDVGVLGVGYRTIRARYIVIVRCDKEDREYSITPLSSYTRVFTSGGYKMLGDVLYDFGTEYFVKKVSALTGIGIDYYFLLNVTEAETVFKNIGTFTVDLTTDIYSDGAAYGSRYYSSDFMTKATPPETTTEAPETELETETEAEVVTTEEVTTEEQTEETTEDETTRRKRTRTSYDIAVRAGKVTVSETNIAYLLMFESFGENENDRCDLEYQIAKGVLTQIASLPEKEKEEFFDKIVKTTSYNDIDRAAMDDLFINSDMSKTVFAKKTKLISSFLKFTINRLDFPMKYVSSGGYFLPDLSEGTTLFSKYKIDADADK